MDRKAGPAVLAPAILARICRSENNPVGSICHATGRACRVAIIW